MGTVMSILADVDHGWVVELAKGVGPSATLVLAFIGYLYIKAEADAKREEKKAKADAEREERRVDAEAERQRLFFEAMAEIGDKCHTAHRDHARSFIDAQKEQNEAMLKSRGQLAETLDRASRAFGRVEAVLERHESHRGAERGRA